MTERETGEHARLESERDFLLRSLDDLESERSAGGIDEPSYAALHDDYTARAAAVIRALRDGIDARPASEPVPWRRRVLVVGGIGALAVGAAFALASALGTREPGQTSSGNTNAQARNAPSAREQLEQAVAQDPTDVASRLLLARYLESDDDIVGGLRQYDAVIDLDPANVQALAHSGRLLYIAAQASPESAVDLVDRARERLDAAVELDPAFPDARYFRAYVLAFEYQDFLAAQNDLRRYLILAPDGVLAEDARDLLAQVTRALESPPTTTTT